MLPACAKLWVKSQVKPFPFLDAELVDPACSADISDAIVKAGSGKPEVVRYYAGTEHDEKDQWRVEPIKKRRYISGEPPPVTFEELFRTPPDRLAIPATVGEIVMDTP